MHVLVVNFNLRGIGEEEYDSIAGSVAPAFADMPGLVSKTWLANPETNTYGGVYVWRDREALEYYKRGEVYRGIEANPHFENVTASDFAVLEGPTSVTRGPVGAVA